jgi:hypothetical protein
MKLKIEKTMIDGCKFCENNKPGLEAGYYCINNCIAGSKYEPKTMIQCEEEIYCGINFRKEIEYVFISLYDIPTMQVSGDMKFYVNGERVLFFHIDKENKEIKIIYLDA